MCMLGIIRCRVTFVSVSCVLVLIDVRLSAIDLGKAGPQFKGGVFTYAGREITVGAQHLFVFVAFRLLGR